MLAELKKSMFVGPDEIKKYLLLTTSHDGTSATRCLPTSERVVCANTLNAALRDGQGEGFAIRHTASHEERIKEAMKVMGAANTLFNNFGETAQQLYKTPFTDAKMKMLALYLFPSEKEGEDVPKQTQTAREELTRLFEFGIGHDKIRGTAWAALNAVTQYADHSRGTRVAEGGNRRENRFASVLLGSGAALKLKAVGAIIKLGAGILLDSPKKGKKE